TVTISKNNTIGKTDSIGVDGIDLLGAETALTIGTYHTKDLVEYFYGRSAQMLDTRAQEGVGQRLLAAGNNIFRFDVAPTVARIVLYRNNYTARDPIRVRTSIGGSCVPQDFNVVNTGGDADWGFPVVINLNGCTHIAFDRVPVASAPALERIVLLPAPTPTLTSGNLYEEFDPGLVYTGVWTESALAPAQMAPSHRLLQTSVLNASMSFTVTGNGFIVYHRVASNASNNVEVCVTTGANPTVCTTYSTQNATTIGSFPIGIYGLGSGTHTVTITNKHSGGNLFL
ncbi:MAG TPA: hypothetical protein PLZ51_15565, partial [Aggregatilineales bacterium]|nr:hypothetical protein [Aggregatilineales bacterium]